MSSKKEISPLSLEFIKRIKDIRIKKGVSQEDLSQRTGLTQSFLSQLEGGKFNLTHKTLKKIAAGLGVELSEIAAGLKESDAVVMKAVPVVERFLTEDELERFKSDKMVYISPENSAILIKRKRREFYYAIEMSDDSMTPTINKGEYVVIIAGDLKFDPYSLENKIVVITNGDKFWVRRIKNKIFMADNLKYKPIKDIKNYKIIGSAVIVVSAERLI